MAKFLVSLPSKGEQFLKRLADDHQVDPSSVLGELCARDFSNSESKKQFELWLDDAFPPKVEVEDKERSANGDTSVGEEEQEEAEEEAHENRDCSEDRELKP